MNAFGLILSHSMATPTTLMPLRNILPYGPSAPCAIRFEHAERALIKNGNITQESVIQRNHFTGVTRITETHAKAHAPAA